MIDTEVVNVSDICPVIDAALGFHLRAHLVGAAMRCSLKECIALQRQHKMGAYGEIVNFYRKQI